MRASFSGKALTKLETRHELEIDRYEAFRSDFRRWLQSKGKDITFEDMQKQKHVLFYKYNTMTAEALKRRAAPSADTVLMQAPDGKRYKVNENEVTEAEANGWTRI